MEREFITKLVVRGLEPIEGGDSIYLYLLDINGNLVPLHGLGESGVTAPPSRTAAARAEEKGACALDAPGPPAAGCRLEEGRGGEEPGAA